MLELTPKTLGNVIDNLAASDSLNAPELLDHYKAVRQSMATNQNREFDRRMANRPDRRTIRFETRAEADQFASAWTRYSSRGHTISNCIGFFAVDVFDVTEGDDRWIDYQLFLQKELDDILDQLI